MQRLAFRFQESQSCTNSERHAAKSITRYWQCISTAVRVPSASSSSYGWTIGDTRPDALQQSASTQKSVTLRWRSRNVFELSTCSLAMLALDVICMCTASPDVIHTWSPRVARARQWRALVPLTRLARDSVRFKPLAAVKTRPERFHGVNSSLHRGCAGNSASFTPA